MISLRKVGVGVFLAFVAMAILHSPRAAASPYLPDAANFSPPGVNGDPWLEVSRPDAAGNVQLNAGASWIKVYSTSPSATLGFDNIQYCAGIDYSVTGSGANTMIRSFATSGAENILLAPDGQLILTGQYDTGGAAGCGIVNFTVNGLTPSTVPGHNGMYVGLVQVLLDTAGEGQINRFAVWGNGNEVGFWDQGKVQRSDGSIEVVNDAYAPTDPRTTPFGFYGVGGNFAIQAPSTQPQNMTIEFAPSCDVTTNRTAYLKWFDADQGMPNQSGPITFSLDEFDQNGNFVGSQHVNYGAVGGQDQYGTLAFTAVPNHKYRWTWFNVDQRNGLQFWLPYDSQNYYFTCDVPPVGDLWGAPTTTCDQVTGWAYDQDSPGTALRIRVYKDALPAFGGTLVREAIANGPGPGAGIPGSHTFSVSIADQKDYSRHRYYVRAFNVNRLGVETGSEDFLPSNNGREIGPCLAPPGCSALVIAASDGTNRPEPSDPFAATMGFQFGGAAPSVTFNYTINMNFPGAAGGVQAFAGSYPANGMTHTFSGISQVAPGAYTGNWTVTVVGTNPFPVAGGANPPQTINCSGPYTVANKPYYKVFGGDAKAGGSYGNAATDTCPAGPSDPSASVVGYDKNAGGYSGASTQYAAFALGRIMNFHTAATSGPPSRLAFGNFRNGVLASTSTVYGGDSGVSQCVHDYFSGHPSAVNPAAAYNATATGAVFLRNGTGRVQINTSAPLTGARVVYVEGDAYIRNNITFGGYASVDTIPSFYLIVKGNIHIDPSVQRIDGVLIAQGTGATGGTVYTCSNWPGGPVANNLLSAQCNNRLVFNGAVIAETIKLMRTIDTLRIATPGETFTTTRAAEIFKYSPEIYLAKPNDILRTLSSSTNAYDSITSLPPIL